MKQIIYISFLVAILFSACSKKKNNVDVDPGGPVTINGTSYPTVKIGSQTWTSVNYNGPGGMNYGGGPTNDPVYGKLYSYTEAEAISLPAGWHLPTESDFATLFSALGGPVPTSQNNYLLPSSIGQQLMSTTTWYNPIGNNKTGFNAVAAGYAVFYLSTGQHYIADFLTSSKFPNGFNVSFEINEVTNPEVVDLNVLTPRDGDSGSVRFVKN